MKNIKNRVHLVFLTRVNVDFIYFFLNCPQKILKNAISTERNTKKTKIFLNANNSRHISGNIWAHLRFSRIAAKKNFKIHRHESTRNFWSMKIYSEKKGFDLSPQF